MKRQSVKSSNLVSVGWERNILEIEFQSGAVYQYFGAPERVYYALLQAKSVGKYFEEHIRNGYPYQRVKN